jgi:hypothetical protein
LLSCLLNAGKRQSSAAIRCGLGREVGQLQDVQRHAGIAVGEIDEKRTRRWCKPDRRHPQATNRIFQRPLDDDAEFGWRQCLQRKDTRSRQEWRNHFEGGILRGGPDKDELAPFHMWQEGILLSFVKAMDFIDKQESTFAMPLAL